MLELLRREGEAGTNAAEPVIIFAGLDRLRVRAEIDETQALAFREGARATVPALGSAAPRSRTA